MAPMQWTAATRSTARPSGMPRVVHRVEAEWPQAARDAGVSGVVVLQVAVASDGTVTDARVLRSIAMLDAAAVAAVRQWRFEAAGPDGRPDPLTMSVPVMIPAPQR